MSSKAASLLTLLGSLLLIFIGVLEIRRTLDQVAPLYFLAGLMISSGLLVEHRARKRP